METRPNLLRRCNIYISVGVCVYVCVCVYVWYVCVYVCVCVYNLLSSAWKKQKLKDLNS
jgi:hypothetical protein